MSNVNQVTLSGNLAADAELRYLSSGTALLAMRLCSNRRYKSKGDWKTDNLYVDVTMWGSRGENLVKYLKKGTALNVYGVLRQENWETDGQKRSKISITADKIDFAGGGKEKNNGAVREKTTTQSAETEISNEIPF